MIVYYSSFFKDFDEDGLRLAERNLDFFEPERLIGIDPEVYGSKDATHSNQSYTRCPAYNDYFKNIFAIKSQTDYDLNIDSINNKIYSTVFNQKFFDQLVFIRSLEHRLISLNIGYIFITEENDLYITQESCMYKKSNFIDNTIMVPGTFNIGAWPRPINIAFHMVGDRLEIKHGDPLFALRFHTNEKIQFKRFFATEKFTEYQQSLLKTKTTFKQLKSLNYLYDIFNRNKGLKKLMLNEVKKNLLD